MHGDTWTEYTIQPAPPNLLCQFRRKDGFAHTGYAKDFLPEFDIAGLQWKLTGIAREQWDRMPDRVKQQVMPQALSQAALDAMSVAVQISCARMTAQIFAGCWGGMKL